MRETFQSQLIEARRNLILDAAIEVIAERGFQRTTIRQIAGKAGVADGTIYNYFKNKDELMMGIVARLSENESQDIGRAEAKALDYATFVSMFVKPRMDEIDAGYRTLKAVLPELTTNAEFGRHAYDDIYAPMFAMLETYFGELIAGGQIDARDPAVAARMFASPFLGLVMLRMLGDEHVLAHWGEYTAEMERFLRRALAREDVGADGDA